MRWVGLLILLTVAVALELQHFGRDRPHGSVSTAVAPATQDPAHRGLTLLDYWSQELVPNMLLQRARAAALRAGDPRRAAQLERRIRNGLQRIQAFGARSAHEVRAVRATGAAWTRWATALLEERRRPRDVASLEANAVRLHQAAYAAVDATIRAAHHARRLGRPRAPAPAR